MRQYYVAMGTDDVKLATLIDLLQAFCANRKRQLAVCCNSRDTLDTMISAVAATQQHQIFTVFSDMTDGEKEKVVQEFKETGSNYAAMPRRQPGESDPGGCVLMATDFALTMLKTALELEMLVNYDLPSSKSMMSNRHEIVFGQRQDTSDAVVVNLIVAGTIEKFRNYEDMCDDPIEVMPLHVAEIFSENIKKT